MNIEAYVTLYEAAELVNLNYHTLRRRVLKKKLKVKRKGPMIFIRRCDVISLRRDSK